MSDERHVMGLFSSEDRTVEAVREINQSSFSIQRVNGPFPSHKVSEALKQKKSPVGLFTLTGGIIGFLFGFGFAIFTAVQWNLIVSGKPVVALIPFFIVGFEFTILFAVFGNVIGLLILARLPKKKIPQPYDIRCTGSHFSILAACDSADEEKLKTLLQQCGGEVNDA